MDKQDFEIYQPTASTLMDFDAFYNTLHRNAQYEADGISWTQITVGPNHTDVNVLMAGLITSSFADTTEVDITRDDIDADLVADEEHFQKSSREMIDSWSETEVTFYFGINTEGKAIALDDTDESYAVTYAINILNLEA